MVATVKRLMIQECGRQACLQLNLGGACGNARLQAAFVVYDGEVEGHVTDDGERFGVAKDFQGAIGTQG